MEKYTRSGFSTISRLLILTLMLTSCFDEQSKTIDSNGPSDYDQPNIIMIVVDDLRWDEFSAAGHPYLLTPNIDRLAEEGVIFENAYQAVPLCSPNRASILTGQYPSRHGIIDNVARDKASHQLDLFAPKLQEAGYETAHVGKWHMGNDPTPRPGYDYWSCLPGQGRIIDPILYENGKLDTIKGYITDILTDRAVEFIAKKRDQPFFLYLGHKAVHPDVKQLDDGSVEYNSSPQFIPAARHGGTYKDAQFNRRKNAINAYDLTDSISVTGNILRKKQSPEIISQFGNSFLDHFTSEQTIQKRSEMLLSVDEGLGRIYDALEEVQILDNTFILFTSDNGYFYGEHGLSIERRFPYEESVRTPLIIRYPALIEKGKRIKEFVLSIDYAPTALMLANAPIGSHIQGKSMIPLLEGKTENWRKSFLIEYYSFENPMPWLVDTDYKVLRTERYKYIHWYKHENKNELYDIREDPFELNNLINQANMHEIIKEMEENLANEIAKSFGLNN